MKHRETSGPEVSCAPASSAVETMDDREAVQLAEALDLAAHLVALHKGIPLEVKLTRLFPEVAAVLKGHNGELSVTGLKNLCKEAAKHLCRHFLLRLDFRHMSLTDELAGVLAGHEGILWLDGLKTLPAAKADVLAAHNGPVLVADETEIEPGPDGRLQECAFQAPILEKGLDLAGAPLRVQRMTTSLAEALVFFREGWLLLDALEKLSVDHARLLGARSGRISLNGLEEASPQVVAKLVARSIALPGSYIPSLIDDSSPWLTWTRHLRLNGLSRLRVEVARELTHFRGILELNGIRTLEAEAAACLATLEGEVHLKGLEDLDEETTRVLSPRQHILRLSPQLAKKFTK